MSNSSAYSFSSMASSQELQISESANGTSLRELGGYKASTSKKNTRSVDFILVYKQNEDLEKNLNHRKIFQENLKKEGLKLEEETQMDITFVKIHIPRNVLKRFAEILKIKFAIKDQNIKKDYTMSNDFHSSMKSFYGRLFESVRLDPKLFPNKKYQLYHEYSRDKAEYLFNTEDPNFFMNSVKFSVINFILERTKFSEIEDSLVGIDRLLADKVYDASYPLHDGSIKDLDSQRRLLYFEWASVNKWIKHQPLDQIKEYFGVKVALYFAWLGFYTNMLISASVVGLICFIYGLSTMWTSSFSNEICDEKNEILMCPQCDETCDYWKLHDTCVYARISHLFDNNMTIVFSMFMSIWSTLYLELWKRYSSEIAHRWGMTDYSKMSEHPRPEYLAKLKRKPEKKLKDRLNTVTGVYEKTVSFWTVKVPSYFLSYSIIGLYILSALVAVFALIIYRMSFSASKTITSEESSVYQVMVVLPVTTGIINLVVITILNYLYDYLAIYLTDLEYRRTQTEYDESLSLKIYLFQFINYYSSIFYIGFIKGKFVGTPAKFNKIFTYRQEECSPAGCLMELCIQLAIIMIGKQAINSILEILLPCMKKTWKTFLITFGIKKNGRDYTSCPRTQWLNDYKLLPWGSRGLFEEYLEMVIQYGFVTLFVVAFPLAPLFALINNVFEMRLDAKKYILYYRRSVPRRIRDIGLWYNVMNILCKMSVITSAIIIAFSSNFIPRWYYMSTNNGSDSGYLNFTLAFFDTKDFGYGSAPLNSSFPDTTFCRYSEFRNPPDDPNPYKRPMTYWHIMTARLAFIVIYQNVVGFLQMFIAWAIPDKPGKLRNLIKREEYLISNIIIEEERKRTWKEENEALSPEECQVNEPTMLF